MVIYGLVSLPLIRKLNIEFKLDRHMWFIDGSGTNGYFQRSGEVLYLLKVLGSSYG